MNIMVSNAWIVGELASSMAPFDITPAQYNVLRILQGSHPDTLTCSDIRSRLLDRTPDVTRLLNRLEKRGLVLRTRSKQDRREVEVGVSEAGLALLARMSGLLDATIERLTGHLTPEDQGQISDLLERMRIPQIG